MESNRHGVACLLRPTPHSELSRRALASLPYAGRQAPGAGLGVKEVQLETRPTDAMVVATGAAGPAPDLRPQVEAFL